MTLWAADFSFAQLSAADLLKAGYCGAMRYITGSGKGITPAEFHDLTTTPGMSLGLVNETQGQAAQGGYNVGRAEAIAAFTRADALGWPKNRPIYFVCEDPNHLPAPQWPAIEAYLKGVASVVPTSRIGDYGAPQQIVHMFGLGLATYGWPVETWPGDPSSCHLRQMYNPVDGAPHNFGGSCDPNMILKPDWGQWSATTAIPVPTPHTGDEAAMISIAFGPNGRVDTCWIAPDKGVWHTWAPTLAAAMSAGTPVERLGLPTDLLLSVNCKWSPDYRFFVVNGQGVDNLSYVSWWDTTTSKWTTFSAQPAVTAATQGLLPPQGAPGPTGPPGVAYNDTAVTGRVTSLEVATKAAGEALAAPPA